MAYKYKYTDTSNGNTAMAWNQRQAIYRLDAKVDVADVITDGTGTLASATQITAAESVAVLDIPKNCLAFGVMTRIITASTDTTATVDVGIDVESPDTNAGDVEGFDAAVDITATAGTNYWSDNANDAYCLQLASGKVFTQADTLDILFNNNTTNGVILFMMLIVDMADPAIDP